jgi:mycofactocin precursor
MSDNAVVEEIITADSAPETPAAPPVLSDLLVEDVSIDGMCGVY